MKGYAGRALQVSLSLSANMAEITELATRLRFLVVQLARNTANTTQHTSCAVSRQHNRATAASPKIQPLPDPPQQIRAALNQITLTVASGPF